MIRMDWTLVSEWAIEIYYDGRPFERQKINNAADQCGFVFPLIASWAN